MKRKLTRIIQSSLLAVGMTSLITAFVFLGSGVPLVHAATSFSGAYADEVIFSAVVDPSNADNVLGEPDGTYADLNDNITVGFGTSVESFDYGVEIPEGTDLIIVDQGTEMPTDPDRVNFGYESSTRSEGDAGLPDGEMHRASFLGSETAVTDGFGTAPNVLFYDIDGQEGFDEEERYGNEFFIAVEGTSHFEIDSFQLNIEDESENGEEEEGNGEEEVEESAATSGTGGTTCVNCADDEDTVDEDEGDTQGQVFAIGGDPEGAVLGATTDDRDREIEEMQETVSMLHDLVVALTETVQLSAMIR